MHSEIIAVGSELLSFARVDTNSVHIASRLAVLGVEVRYKQVIGDRIDDISRAISLALERSTILFVTGGLGPTNDDVTREALSLALGRELQEDPGILKVMEITYRKWGRRMSENNRKQAMVPRGAMVLSNPNGTAPGLFLVEGEKLVFLLPGPPRELNPILEKDVIPLIRKHKQVAELPSRHLKIASIAESVLDARIEGIYRQYQDIDTTILATPGVISLYFIGQGGGGSGTEARLEELVGRIRAEMGIAVLTDREMSLEEVVGSILREKGKTLALAESCTGGLISKLLTDVPGSSGYFLGGVVSYSNSVKTGILGVRDLDLEVHGAVSEVVAEQMAEGVRQTLGADLGLSVTGVAGPDGGTPAKPVGTVFIGLAGERGIQSWHYQGVGARDMIRLRSANLALDRLRIWLLTEL